MSDQQAQELTVEQLEHGREAKCAVEAKGIAPDFWDGYKAALAVSVQVERPDEATITRVRAELHRWAIPYLEGPQHPDEAKAFAPRLRGLADALAARLPERPDCPNCKGTGRGGDGGQWACSGCRGSGRLPERPDEEREATCECCGKRALEPITDPEEGIDFCPRCAIDGAVAVASEARPADEGKI